MSDQVDAERLVQLGDYTRFPPSKYTCPVCGQLALEDWWPPNYGGSHGTCAMDGSSNYWEEEGSVKCVCVPCRVAFRVSYRRTNKEPEVLAFSETVPLVERDGKLLTPHDVWRDDYRVEHGEYPKEAYG